MYIRYTGKISSIRNILPKHNKMNSYVIKEFISFKKNFVSHAYVRITYRTLDIYLNLRKVHLCAKIVSANTLFKIATFNIILLQKHQQHTATFCSIHYPIVHSR